MSSARPIARGNAKYICQTCNLGFETQEMLNYHKVQKRAEKPPTHFHCKHCDVDFLREEEESLHIREVHGQHQEIECPGCGQGPFARVSALMGHIESGECTQIDTRMIEAVRAQKYEFPHALQRLTGSTVKNNYSSFMPSITETSLDTSLPKENDVWGAKEEEPVDVKPHSSQLHSNEEAKPTPLWGDHRASPGQTLSSPGPPDPGHPDFKVSRYYCRIAERFNCPQRGCGKTFKKPGQLIGHLKSPAHGNKTYTCPGCHKRFKSMQAMAAHAESDSNRCKIRHSPMIRPYLDQLTGGMIDVAQALHTDGTVKYLTSESAKKMYGESPLQSSDTFARSSFEDSWPEPVTINQETHRESRMGAARGSRQGSLGPVKREMGVEIKQERPESVQVAQNPKIKQEPLEAGNVDQAPNLSWGYAWTARPQIRVKQEPLETPNLFEHENKTEQEPIQSVKKEREESNSPQLSQRTDQPPSKKKKFKSEPFDGTEIKEEPIFDNIVW